MSAELLFSSLPGATPVLLYTCGNQGHGGDNYPKGNHLQTAAPGDASRPGQLVLSAQPPSITPSEDQEECYQHLQIVFFCSFRNYYDLL